MEEGGSWLSFEDIYCVIVDNIGMVFNFVVFFCLGIFYFFLRKESVLVVIKLYYFYVFYLFYYKWILMVCKLLGCFYKF